MLWGVLPKRPVFLSWYPEKCETVTKKQILQSPDNNKKPERKTLYPRVPMHRSPDSYQLITRTRRPLWPRTRRFSFLASRSRRMCSGITTYRGWMPLASQKVANCPGPPFILKDGPNKILWCSTKPKTPSLLENGHGVSSVSFH